MKMIFKDLLPSENYYLNNKIRYKMKSLTGTIILIFITAFQIVNAQQVNVAISYDTVYAGNDIAVQYSMENWQGELKNPDFGEFKVVGGPQMTSSRSYSGGQRHSSKSITF